MADSPVDLLVRAGVIPVCEQNLCVRVGWCSDGVSGVVFLQWRAWKSKMDEVVFLSVLSGSSDFVRNSACYDLWRYQSDCLVHYTPCIDIMEIHIDRLVELIR